MELNDPNSEVDSESAWHYLNETQQQALSQKLQGGAA